MMNAIIATTLTNEKKNSLSPKPFTVKALMAKIIAKNIALLEKPGNVWKPKFHNELDCDQFK